MVVPMKSLTGLLVLAPAVFLTVLPIRRLAAQSDRPAEGHWACFSAYEDNPIYVTPVWDGTATMDDVNSAFAHLLLTKYGYKGRVSCSRADMSGSTLAGLSAGREQEFAQWRKNGKQVVPTGWTYPLTKVATIALAPDRHFSVCYSQRTTEGKMYFSPVVQTRADEAALKDAFVHYLAKQYGYAPKYGYRGFLTCYTGLSQADAETMRKGNINNTRAVGETTVVEIEWTGPGTY